MKFLWSLACVGLCLSLVGCGFEPLYGPSSLHSSQDTADQGMLSKIRVNLIADRRGQLLRNHLISLLTPLGQPKKPLYLLDVTLTESSQALGILKDATFSKSQMTYVGDFTLKDAATHKVLLKNKSSVVADYNVITNSEFATVVSAQSAKDRSMVLLAQQISRELGFFFHEEEVDPSENSKS